MLNGSPATLKLKSGIDAAIGKHPQIAQVPDD